MIDQPAMLPRIRNPDDFSSMEAGSPGKNVSEGRRWGGISRELERIKRFDENVHAEMTALLARIDLLEADNHNLRGELADRQRFEGKE